MVAMVGRMRAPHNTRVAEMGSDSGTVSAGTLDDLEYSVDRGGIGCGGRDRGRQKNTTMRKTNANTV